ncbi:hypothetical protein Pelo_18818 [Pelomyxa schiedti]|nr:hypothetical protein Pelo_18818 [Pelomyxa schiedti]
MAATGSVVVAANFRLVRAIAHGSNGIVYEVKCIGKGHPDFFSNHSYALKAIFNFGVATKSVPRAFKNEYNVSSTIDPHPNINRYYCNFTDRPPPEYYDLLPHDLKYLVFDQERQRVRSCEWIVLEHHAETLRHFLDSLIKTCPGLSATPWCIVHKYSRDICAALVHLYKNQTIHFDMKLDNIVVSSSKEQAIVIDFGCATKFPKGSFEKETVALPTILGNKRHTAPEIHNGISLHSKVPVHGAMLNCEKITFSDSNLFPMTPEALPREFRDLVHALLQCDPEKRIPLLDASEVLASINDPSPAELLSFYIEPWMEPRTKDAGLNANHDINHSYKIRMVDNEGDL